MLDKNQAQGALNYNTLLWSVWKLADREYWRDDKKISDDLLCELAGEAYAELPKLKKAAETAISWLKLR